MSTLVLATYDLGHPPVDAIELVAQLRGRGEQAEMIDLSVDQWPTESIAAARAVVVLAGMHTAAKLGVVASQRIRASRPDVPIACFGLYAPVLGVDEAQREMACFGPEDRQSLLGWIDGNVDGATVERGAATAAVPSLERYARLSINGELRLAGAVAASRGCVHRCRHCPIPPAYDGRIKLAARDDVMASIRAQVDAGATHISFTDPDFLNAPSHARRIVTLLRECHPNVTFDCTVKVEHIVRHRALWPLMADAGCLFVTSAFECVDDATLRVLDKGHTQADMSDAVRVLRDAGIELRPTFLPFTPWTELAHIRDLFDFVERHDLIESVDPVQLSIRLLVPPRSLLLEQRGSGPSFEPYDAETLSHPWRARDPLLDRLQAGLADIAADAATEGKDAFEAFGMMRSLVNSALGERGDVPLPPLPDRRDRFPRPRLTEPWFC